MDNKNSFASSSVQRKHSILLSWPRSGTNYFLAVYSRMFPGDTVFDEIFREGGDKFAMLIVKLKLDKTENLELVELSPNILRKMIEQHANNGGDKVIVKVFYYQSQNVADL